MQRNRNKQLAVLITCHNRREVTLKCLKTLKDQTGVECVTIDIYLVDDGSTDGTAVAVRERYPDVQVIDGDGNLYWTGGMRLAMDMARIRAPDFYLWLNDDTIIYPDAIARLLTTFAELAVDTELPPIVVGSLRDPDTGELTYGGSCRVNRWHPLRFSRVSPGSSPKRCDVFNGNLVLFHRAVVNAIGNLHPRLVHVAGDYDYALRAHKAGVDLWIAPNFFGDCRRNSLSSSSSDPSATLSERYKRLIGVKGQPPVPRFVYYRAHGGPLWFLLYPLVYARPLVSSLSRKLRRQ